MSAITFQKASKRQARARLALVGPSSSGKTYTGLSIGTGLGNRMAVIDSERGSASKYSDLFEFDVLEPESFSPETYIEAIKAAGAAGYDVLLIDSLSHAWMGKDGALELVDVATKKSQSSNSFAAWREVTPMHNQLVDEILRSPMHIIATMRTKTEYVLERDERTGKTAPRKVGLQPVQRAGLEYEFDVVADLDLQHNFIVSKTRCPALDDKLFTKPGRDVAEILKTWLDTGEPLATPEQHGELLQAIVALTDLDADKDWRAIAEAAARRDYSRSTPELTQKEMAALVEQLNTHAAALRVPVATEEKPAEAAAVAASEEAPAAAETAPEPEQATLVAS